MTVHGAARLKAERLAEPVLVQSPFAVRHKMREAAGRCNGLLVVDPASPSLLRKNAEQYAAARQAAGKAVSVEDAEAAVNNSLATAAMMVRRGEVEAGVAGNLSTTAAVIRAGLHIIPRKPGIKTISSFFLMLSTDDDRRQHRDHWLGNAPALPQPSPRDSVGGKRLPGWRCAPRPSVTRRCRR